MGYADRRAISLLMRDQVNTKVVSIEA